MDWRLFAGTFILIFFAELGDKTQLAAMASAAGNRSIWSVFAGASSALVVSTFIAVLLGAALQKYAPQNLIKIVAGALFLLFGALLLWSAMTGRAVEAAAVKAAAAEAAAGKVTAVGAAPAKAAEARPGFLSRVILDAAARFEDAAVADYAALAQTVRTPELQSLFTALAIEERRHLARVEELSRAHAAPLVEAQYGPEEAKQPDFPRFLWASGELLDKEMEILAAAIRQEKAQAAFYDALAQSTLLPGPKAAFQRLAEEERDHLHRLRNVQCA